MAHAQMDCAAVEGEGTHRLWPVHVEVRLSKGSKTSYDSIERLVHQHLLLFSHVYTPSVVTAWEDSAILTKNIETITVSESGPSSRSIPIENCAFYIHIYSPSDEAPHDHISSNPSDPSEELTAASVAMLPNEELEGLWESLYYEGDVKSKLLNYIYATIAFSDANVNCNLVSWNRLVLLHGPPGTGKTSLCRALAQKLSIRLKSRYTNTRLLEINSHSLFSRWFSESGKLVQNLFNTVGDMVEDEDDFIVLLIDEVESLTAARAGAMAGTEPSDALRVVNALLTQLDKLKHQKNVLVMATSNLAQAIDAAFIDRADIVQYIDFPPAEAIYKILRSSLEELMEKGMVARVAISAVEYARDVSHCKVEEETPCLTNSMNSLPPPLTTSRHLHERNVARRLYALSERCKGLSGRTLRRLPVLAQANHIGLFPAMPAARLPNNSAAQTNGTDRDSQRAQVPLTQVEAWLDAMDEVVESQMSSRSHLER